MNDSVKRWAGIYRVLEDELDVGTEVWTREVADDQIRLTSIINRDDESYSFEEELDITLTGEGVPISLSIERTSSEGTRRYIGRRVGEAWVSRIFRESGPMRTTTLNISDETHIDYLTAHTNSTTIQRLSLEPGSGREIEVVFVDPDSFTPSLVRQHYSRLDDLNESVVAGVPITRAYRYQGASGVGYTIWTGDDDIVLRYEDLFETVEFNRIQR